jgi:hypothetical protein
MKALVIIQSPRLDTYTNVFAAICKKYPNVEHIRILYISEDNTSITKKDIREKLVELSRIYPHYEPAADVQLSTGKSSIENIKKYIQEWNIIDVTGVSKELSLTIAAMSISYKHTKVCLINWSKQFKQGEKWIIDDDNHEYINLLSSGDLSLLRKDYFQKKYVITAFAGIFGLLTITVILKMIFPTFFIPNIIVNIFGLLIGIAGLYLASISLKNDS